MTTGNKPSVVIIGGGMAGLGGALALLEQGFPVTILETQARPGGLAGSFQIQGRSFPLGYHHILAEDKPLLQTLKTLGLYDRVRWKKGQVLFAIDNKVYNLENPADFLAFPLPFIDKIRFAGLMLYCALKKDWQKNLGNARDWLDKTAGANVRQTIFDPLMDIKYGLPSGELSANWLGSRLHYREFSKPLGYIPGTDWTYELTKRLVERITKLGGKILTGATVLQLEIEEGNCTSVTYIKDAMQKQFATSIVVNTAPPHIFRTFSAYTTKPLAENTYLDALSLIMEIEENLPYDFYLLSCLKPRYSFGGIFMLSALNPTLGIQSKPVINFFTTLSPKYEYLRQKTAEELSEIYRRDATELFGFRPTPIWHHLTLIKNYSPRFLHQYQNPDQRSAIRGLYFAGNYLTYPVITSTGSAFASGQKAAKFILKDYGS